MDDHTNFFNFKKELYEYVNTVNKDLSNLINLVLLGSPSYSDKSTVANSTIMLEQEATMLDINYLQFYNFNGISHHKQSRTKLLYI